MKISSLFKACKNLTHRLHRDKRGVSAIEFAMVFPVLLIIYFGIVEVTQVLSVDRKVTNIASSVADLVAQETSVDNATMQDIFSASTSIIAPFNSNSVSIVVTSVVADKDNKTSVAWSDTFNGTAKTPGSAITMPTGLLQANTSVILTEVVYNYTSIMSYIVASSITLSDKFYTRPRGSNEVTHN